MGARRLRQSHRRRAPKQSRRRRIPCRLHRCHDLSVRADSHGLFRPAHRTGPASGCPRAHRASEPHRRHHHSPSRGGPGIGSRCRPGAHRAVLHAGVTATARHPDYPRHQHHLHPMRALSVGHRPNACRSHRHAARLPAYRQRRRPGRSAAPPSRHRRRRGQSRSGCRRARHSAQRLSAGALHHRRHRHGSRASQRPVQGRLSHMVRCSYSFMDCLRRPRTPCRRGFRARRGRGADSQLQRHRPAGRGRSGECAAHLHRRPAAHRHSCRSRGAEPHIPRTIRRPVQAGTIALHQRRRRTDELSRIHQFPARGTRRRPCVARHPLPRNGRRHHPIHQTTSSS